MLPHFIRSPDPTIYLTGTYLIVDVETTNLSKGDAVNLDNRLVYGYWRTSTGGQGEFTGEHNLQILFDLILKVDFVVMQGGKFELKWFRRMGFPIWKILPYDTLLGEYVLAGNRKWKLDLDSISRRYGGSGKQQLVSLLIRGGVCPSEIPKSLLRHYCIKDVIATERVFLKQRQVLKDKGLLAVQYMRCITTPLLADIEMNGIFLDHALVRRLHNAAVKEHTEVTVKLNEITGGINMASPSQVAKFLYGELGFEELRDKDGPIRGKPSKQFPEGAPKTDEETILALKSKDQRQKSFIKLKQKESKLRRKITGYTNKMLDACENAGGYMHGNLNQTIAQTHRLTSSNP